MNIVSDYTFYGHSCYIRIDIDGSLGKLQMLGKPDHTGVNVIILQLPEKYEASLRLNSVSGKIYGVGNSVYPKNKETIMLEYFAKFVDAIQEQLYVKLLK